MTARPRLTPDHYKDAVAVMRATLNGDESGLMALAESMNVAMVYQATVRLHLSGLLEEAGGRRDIVDAFLANFLAEVAEFE